MERQQIDQAPFAQPDGYELEPYSHAAAAPGWTRAEPRLIDYLRACGVRDDNSLAVLLGRIRGRISSRKSTRYDDDPVALAIREAVALVDDWLAVELGLDRHQDRDRILEARAVLFRGEAGDWARVLLSAQDAELVEAVRRAALQPVPPLAPMAMPTQRIGLRYFSLRRMMLRLVVRLGALFGLRR